MKKLGLVVFVSLIALAQENVDLTNDAKMRSEELEHSQILHTLHMLTDRYGPRVTGTPNHELAAKWAVAEMERWGMKNGHLEPWEFGHPGWLNETAEGHIVAPVKENLKFEVLAWTPSTAGKVTSSAREQYAGGRHERQRDALPSLQGEPLRLRHAHAPGDEMDGEVAQGAEG